MMELVGNWLTGITAAAILCALANSLMPDGPVRRVGRLACGLAVLAAVLGPVLRLEPIEPEAWLEEYGQVMAIQRQELERTREETICTVIEQSCAAYISDKAADLGAVCTVQVTCVGAEEESWLPDRVAIQGVLTSAQREALSRTIWTELGVPETNQSFETEEELP
ncbi:MAG: stage III sporulation protein AF [Oscillospiraceae bacterium]|jgi:hypothetical protein|nr:stage III sporulation protein AF [Oscillospiraceae bacterium]